MIHPNFMFILFFCALFLGSPVAGSANSFQNTSIDLKLVEAQRLDSDPSWLRLLYYRDGRSEVSNPKFFLHPKGRTQPKKEFLETVQQMMGMSESEPNELSDDHVICRFPARYKVLSQLLGRPEAAYRQSIKKCKKLQDFFKRSRPKSVSLVFSSYFLHNPSSAFGHTLLKINRLGKNDEDLLGYGINFAATVDTENALVYAFKGLFGFFYGQFKAIPYYYKVREYNDYESRDLWSYELDLNRNELDTLLLHIWELEEASSSYLYLTKNCSYWMLRVIEAISPRLQLSQELPFLYVIPIDTVRALYSEPNLVKKVSLRPSLRRQVFHHFSRLNKDEKKQVQRVSERLFNANPQWKGDKELSNAVLDAAISYYDYRFAKEMGLNEKETLKKKRPLLIARSQSLSKPSVYKMKFSGVTPPESFHPSSQVHGFVGEREGKKQFGLGWKPALQDLVDPNWGFDPYSEINFLDLSVQAIEETEGRYRFELGHLDLVRVGVLTPQSELESKMAWRFKVGAQELYWENCSGQCKSAYLSLSTGASWAFGATQEHIVFTLFRNQVEASSKIEHSGVRVALGPHLGVRYSWSDRFKSLAEFNYLFLHKFEDEWRDEWWVQHSHQYYLKNSNWAVLLAGEHRERDHQGRIHLKYFF